ncbi:MAG: phosphatidylserine decarboxylase [Nocardiaceae bacterium]|nr:phosphatidylserine decarboxylase [Nocardiaceae bacterium]
MARRPYPEGTPEKSPIGHLVELVKTSVPPIHPDGAPFVLGPLAIAALGRRHTLIRRTGQLTALACAAFFRHPNRVPPTRPGVAVAPADGTITLVDEAAPPAELGLGDTPLPRVSIFLSVLDVHVQRAPVEGTVHAVIHQPGKFMSADLAEASDHNERNTMVIATHGDQRVIVVQIAGLIARRIVCHAGVGDQLQRGQTYGLIRFGSRVDTFLPAGSKLLVEVGQRAVGAETILAELPESTR